MNITEGATASLPSLPSSSSQASLVVNWSELPSLVLYKVFVNLTSLDRRNSSAVCYNWRCAFFQKKFFRNVSFILDLDNEDQLKFFFDIMYRLTEELTLKFDYTSGVHFEHMRCVLECLQTQGRTLGIRFQAKNGAPVPDSSHPTRLKLNKISPELREFYFKHERQCFLDALQKFIKHQDVVLHILDFGGIEPLILGGGAFISDLKHPEKLKVLTLASVKYTLHPIYSTLRLDNLPWQRFNSLQILSLNYDSTGDELMKELLRLPLRKLMLYVHGFSNSQCISAETWMSFAATFPNIQLILTLAFTEAAKGLRDGILNRHMPLTHLRVVFCDLMDVQALDWLAQHNPTLQSIQWVDSAYIMAVKKPHETKVLCIHDPFVMLAWRCRRLFEIVVHGYAMDFNNLVGIARLRGGDLKRLEVSHVELNYSDSILRTFMQEMNTLLGHTWRPADVNTLHPALGILPPETDEVRVNFLMELMRNDLMCTQ